MRARMGRTDRVAKYIQVMHFKEVLGSAARFPSCFGQKNL
jgi:enolase